MKNEIQKVMDILLEEFYSVYCDTCKYYDTDSCDECHRKYMNWSLSSKTATDIANRIIKVFQD